MESITQKKPAIERADFRTRDGSTIPVAHFHTKGEEKGILLIPPLIGGSFLLFGRQFSYLVRQGYRVVSFNYQGHQKSGGTFTLSSSFDDTLDIAAALRREQPHLPLIGVGTCSGSMPLFHILNNDPDLLDRLVFVNAIYHLQQTATPLQALRMYLDHEGYHWPASLGAAASIVLDEIFPAIDKGPDHFGIMPYERVDIPCVAREYLFHRKPNTRFVSDKPALCLYGLGDEMLHLDEPEREKTYQDAFLRRFPNAQFTSFEADHFMTGIKDSVAQEIHSFLEN